MSSATWFGTTLTGALSELPGSPERERTLDKDILIRRYKTRAAYIPSGIPAFGSTSAGYTGHYLSSYRYKATGEDDAYEVELKFETNDTTSILNPSAPLPPDEVEFIGGVTERHLGMHPSYNPAWLGTPKSVKPGTSDLVDDPYGIPTAAATKPGQSYFIPTGIYRKVTYTHTKPAIKIDGHLATRDIPTGESGANQWLKTGYNLRITKGVYQISEEWTYLPIGIWDTDIYS